MNDDMGKTPTEMREDALIWQRAGYPAVAVGRYSEAADQVERLRQRLEAAERQLERCGFSGTKDKVVLRLVYDYFKDYKA